MKGYLSYSDLEFDNYWLRKRVFQLELELAEERKRSFDSVDLLMKGEALRGRTMLAAITGRLSYISPTEEMSTWLGESISMVAVAGFDTSLPMHPKCSSLFQSLIGQEYTALPEGPLRTEFLASV